MVRRSALFSIPRLVALAVFSIPLCVASGIAHGQITAQTLVGKAVSDDAQYGDINNAIGRFRDRDIVGCRTIPSCPPRG
jgi:hypothetical protein